MIKNISVSNYRSFTGTTQIELRPITIFVGPNSAGKSSLLKLFKMLQLASSGQKSSMFVSLGKEDDVFDSLLSLKGNSEVNPSVSFTIPLIKAKDSEFINGDLFRIDGKGLTTTISFSETGQSLIFENLPRNVGGGKYKTSRINADELFDNYDCKILNKRFTQINNIFRNWVDKYSEIFDISLADLETECLNWNSNIESRKLLFNGLIYYGDSLRSLDNTDNLKSRLEIWLKVHSPIENSILDLSQQYYDVLFNRIGWYERFLTFLADLDNLFKKNTLNKKSNAIKLNLSLIKALHGFLYAHYSLEKAKLWDAYYRNAYNPAIKNILGNIVSISPLRPHPQPFYTRRDLQRYILLGLEENGLPNEIELEKLILRINSDLEYLGSNYQFNLRSVDSGGAKGIFAIEFYDKKLNRYFTLNDVGFGYSQILPIIATVETNRSIYNFNRSIIIEQPELHLHPQFQSRFARVLANGVFDLKGRILKSRQLIIETHSEHVVRGFQVMVAKGELKPDDISIYYINKDQEGISHAEIFELDQQGFFTKIWPEGFFDQAFLQSVELVSGNK